MHIKDLEKIAKVVEKFGIEFYNEHKDEIDAVDLLYSKIRMPFIVDHLPKLEMTDDDRLLLRAGDHEFWLYEANHPDYPSLDKAYIFEHMKKPPQREMTVAEIEKELGYKVKVIGGPYDKREK